VVQYVAKGQTRKSLGSFDWAHGASAAKKHLMRFGHFFLVIDGLSESTIRLESLQAHLTDYGTVCPLLLASRPSEDYRRVIEATDAWLIAEPALLDDRTLESFVEQYGASAASFDDDLKEACPQCAR
jgi:hypothetical protein